MANVHKQKVEEQEENLWSTILKDVATSSARNRPEVTKTLLVLGDINSGKSTLMDRLCQISKTHPMGGKYTMSGCGLEYRFIDVQDEETDDLLDRMSIWILDGVVWHSHLLPFSLNKSSIEHTGVMIVVDMTQPWNIMESLERWMEVLWKHINNLNLSSTLVKEMRDRLVKQFQSYVDPEEPVTPVVSSAGDEDSVALPLGETTLSSNLGIPIIVVCSKSDMVVELEKTHGYRDEHFDFIQQAIRKFCLKYGAALFYTSTKEDKNLQILHKYLLHRAYDLPFKEVAWVIDKDSIFIPSGWDNEKKIEILQEHMKGISLSDEYESIIMPPKHSQPETAVSLMSAEDDQVFLLKLQAQMNKSPRAPSNTTIPASASRESKPSYSTPPQATTENDKADGETVLANFFNSLLTSKKPPMKSGMSSRATNRNEAAAEMDKLMGKKS